MNELRMILKRLLRFLALSFGAWMVVLGAWALFVPPLTREAFGKSAMFFALANALHLHALGLWSEWKEHKKSTAELERDRKEMCGR